MLSFLKRGFWDDGIFPYFLERKFLVMMAYEVFIRRLITTLQGDIVGLVSGLWERSTCGRKGIEVTNTSLVGFADCPFLVCSILLLPSFPPGFGAGVVEFCVGREKVGFEEKGGGCSVGR